MLKWELETGKKVQQNVRMLELEESFSTTYYHPLILQVRKQFQSGQVEAIQAQIWVTDFQISSLSSAFITSLWEKNQGRNKVNIF